MEHQPGCQRIEVLTRILVPFQDGNTLPSSRPACLPDQDTFHSPFLNGTPATGWLIINDGISGGTPPLFGDCADDDITTWRCLHLETVLYLYARGFGCMLDSTSTSGSKKRLIWTLKQARFYVGRNGLNQSK